MLHQVARKSAIALTNAAEIRASSAELGVRFGPCEKCSRSMPARDAVRTANHVCCRGQRPLRSVAALAAAVELHHRRESHFGRCNRAGAQAPLSGARVPGRARRRAIHFEHHAHEFRPRCRDCHRNIDRLAHRRDQYPIVRPALRDLKYSINRGCQCGLSMTLTFRQRLRLHLVHGSWRDGFRWCGCWCRAG